MSRRSEHHQPLESHSNIEVIGLSRMETISSIDSDATIDNLPGAGRTIGRFLSWLGSRLEKTMNKRAARLGLGPREVAGEIRQSTGYESVFSSKSETKILRNLCDRLIRLARSRVISTQLDALDEIVNLAIEDPLICAILASCDLNRLVTHYSEPDLLLSTERALGAVEFTHVHRVWEALFISLSSRRSRDVPPRLKEDVFETLRNPTTSFLAGRYYKHVIWCPHRIFNKFLNEFWDLYISVAARQPKSIEWSTFYSYIAAKSYETSHRQVIVNQSAFRGFQFLRLGKELDVMTLMYHIPTFFLEHFKVPKDNKLSFSALEDMYGFLCHLTKSSNYFNHLSYVIRLSSEERRKLKGIIFGERTSFVYNLLIIHLMKSRFDNFTANYSALKSMFVPLVYCAKLDSLEECTLAISLTAGLGAIHRYYKLAIFQAAQEVSMDVYALLSCTSTSNTQQDMTRLVRADENLPYLVPEPQIHTILYRISHSNRKECCIMQGTKNGVSRPRIPRCQHQDAFAADEMYLTEDDIMFIDVDGDGKPFCSTGHYPVAAYFSEEKPFYVARVDDDIYTTVEEGASTVTYLE
ncbi:hypothetical protein SCHPADRAFT_897309 [Schizopora paradoxa]|uniref:Uncharacterized protein n=1 Tax=Schizopora paradoxa TaxID=27342 RepID=A0A0H2QXI9_9AGAM|nr:hypothetical protein SCHPADRAFT_897309 [Schizopora paradoxa]